MAEHSKESTLRVSAAASDFSVSFDPDRVAVNLTFSVEAYSPSTEIYSAYPAIAETERKVEEESSFKKNEEASFASLGM